MDNEIEIRTTDIDSTEDAPSEPDESLPDKEESSQLNALTDEQIEFQVGPQQQSCLIY